MTEQKDNITRGEFFGRSDKSFHDDDSRCQPEVDAPSEEARSSDSTHDYSKVQDESHSALGGVVEVQDRYGSDPSDMSRPLYGASFSQAIIRFFSRYARFKGYSSRSEYWWAYLFNMVVEALFGVFLVIAYIPLLSAAAVKDASGMPMEVGSFEVLFPLLLVGFGAFVYWVATIVPRVALTVRRIRDTGRDWPWIFVVFIPYIGGILLMVLCALETNMSAHRPEWEDNDHVSVGSFAS